MRAGKMDRRIVIQVRAVVGKSSSGEEIHDWVPFRTCWAEFVADRGQEIFKSHQRQGESSGLFRIRHFPGITSSMRVVYDGRNFDIASIVPMRGRDSGLELFVNEGLTNG